ncbi:MAG: 50S ribosomal protein L3 [Nitrospiraceae bacterium]|nr:50S ribosomal protein L3 [Nitrospiraceae bacterium]
MAKGILGIKMGMTSVYVGDKLVPVTVIKTGPCTVVGKKTPEKDGYSALQLGFIEIKADKLNRPEAGAFKKNNLPAFKFVREIRDMEGEIGDKVTVELFKDDKFVRVSNFSKGKGFSGVVKRWGFHGWPKTHGSDALRRPGSIGAGSTPGKVIKGKHMPGHLGVDWTTVSNMKVVKTVAERNLLLVKGNIPGSEKSLVVIKA